MTMRWPFPVAPLEDELLSSFLVRAAHQHGLSPHRFCAFHFPSAPIWNRDIDRSAPDLLLEEIARQAGLPLEHVVRMTLRGANRATTSRNATGSAPWINSIGVYHRLRRCWGMQFCGYCLRDEAGLRRAWRMSFSVLCQRHQRLLQDACPSCDAPLAIHRQMFSIRLCYRCSSPLIRTTDVQPALPAPLRHILRAQSRVERAFSRPTTRVGQHRVTCRELLDGARVLMTFIRTPAREGRRGRGLEQTRVRDRALCLVRLEAVLACWPQAFSQFASEHHLSQRSFARHELPAWLAAVVDTLPAGSKRPNRSVRQHRTIDAKLAAIRRSAVDWRTIRAELLWRAATR